MPERNTSLQPPVHATNPPSSKLASSGPSAEPASPPVGATLPAADALEPFASKVQFGKLAKEFCGVDLPVQVLRSGAGYYLGTIDDEGPCSRESDCYWGSRDAAQAALDSGDWPQKPNP